METRLREQKKDVLLLYVAKVEGIILIFLSGTDRSGGSGLSLNHTSSLSWF